MYGHTQDDSTRDGKSICKKLSFRTTFSSPLRLSKSTCALANVACPREVNLPLWLEPAQAETRARGNKKSQDMTNIAIAICTAIPCHMPLKNRIRNVKATTGTINKVATTRYFLLRQVAHAFN